MSGQVGSKSRALLKVRSHQRRRRTWSAFHYPLGCARQSSQRMHWRMQVHGPWQDSRRRGLQRRTAWSRPDIYWIATCRKLLNCIAAQLCNPLPVPRFSRTRTWHRTGLKWLCVSYPRRLNCISLWWKFASLSVLCCHNFVCHRPSVLFFLVALVIAVFFRAHWVRLMP